MREVGMGIVRLFVFFVNLESAPQNFFTGGAERLSVCHHPLKGCDNTLT